MKHLKGMAVVLALIFGFAFGAMGALAQETAAAKQVKVLIKGLDGGDYEAYKPSLVTRVQEALKKEGLYTGEVSGNLDEATMNALAEYQKKNGLQASGVPSPKTRERLLQG